MSMDFNFLVVALVFLVAVTTPGPANIAISYIALHSGRTPALIFAAGVVCGSFTWAVFMMLAIEYIEHHYATYLTYLNILSGAYFMFLAYRTLYSNSSHSQPGLNSTHLFFSGLVLHLTNPKAFIVWSSIFTIAANINASPIMTLISCFIFALIIFNGYALLFSKESLRAYYGKNERIITYGVSVFFVGLALFMFSHTL